MENLKLTTNKLFVFTFGFIAVVFVLFLTYITVLNVSTTINPRSAFTRAIDYRAFFYAK